MKKIIIITACIAFFSLPVFSQITTAQNTTKPVNTVQPKIMVVPYTKTGEDIRTILEADLNKRIAVTKVKEAFDNRKFTTVDFSAKLKNAIDNNIFTSGAQSDIKTQIIQMSSADIYVVVEVPDMIVSSSGNAARLILTGYEVSTGNSLSNKVCESPKFFTNDFGALVSKALATTVDEFLNTMQIKFTDIVENGRSIQVDLKLTQGTKYKFSTEIAPDGLPLSDLIEAWMGENSFKNNYHIQGTTDVNMLFDDVRIPLKDANGRNYNPNQFALKLYMYLKSKQVNCEKDIKNGIIYITIK